MWEDEILEELYRIREEHAKAFNYDFKAIFADWQKKQSMSGRELISLPSEQESNKSLESTTQHSFV